MEKWVVHEKYGKGIVVKTRYLGHQQLIKFTNGFEKWILSHELKSMELSTPTDTNSSIRDKGSNISLYPRSYKPVIILDETEEKEITEQKNVLEANDILDITHSSESKIGFDETGEKETTEQKNVLEANDILDITHSSESKIGFDETGEKETTEQINVLEANDILDITHSSESKICFDETEEKEITEQKNVLEANDILDITHSSESKIGFDETEEKEITEQKNVLEANDILDITHSSESKIGFDETEEKEITEQKNVLEANDILDITHSSESKIGFDKPPKTETIYQLNVVLRNDIQFIDNSCSTSLKNKGDISSRMIIEALRLGGVSHEQAEVFTCGRKKEIRDVKKWMMSKEGCLLISGEYGVGKTHLLEVISSMAIRDGWAVARIEIDPDESPLHKPKQVYDHFVRSLSYKQSDKLLGFEDLIISIAESTNSERKERLLKHPYLGKVLTHWNYEEDKSWLLDWIKGDGSRPTNFPQMYDTQTTANIYCNILSGLGWSVKNILGLKGIIILFDEAECVDADWYTLYQFDKALRFLKGIILTSNNDERLLKDCKSLYASGELGLGYYGGSRKQCRYPYLWENESCLKLIFSFVPDMLDSMSNNKKIYEIISELPRIKIDTLEEHDLQNALEKIIDVYENAYYDFAFKYDICDIYPYLSSNKTRTFLKGAVECLDIMRFNPEMQPNEILDYAE